MLTRNKIFVVLASVFATAALLCLTGPLMQTFLLELGVSDEMVGLHATLLQATSVSSIVIFSRFADKGRLILRTAMCYLPQAVLFLCYLPLCSRSANPTTAFATAAVIGVVQTFFTALHTVCSYKLPYYLYRPSDFGTIASVGGILGSVLSLGVGSAMSALTDSGRYDYIKLMLVAFIIASVLMFLAFGCTLLLRVLPPEITAAGLSAKLDGEEDAPRTEKKVPLLKMFRMPIFLQLLAPNLFRGFAGGVTLVFAVVASKLEYSTSVMTALTATQSIAVLAGCLFYGAFTRRFRSRWLILSGSLLFLLFPLVAIPSSVLFLVVTSVVLFGRTLVDYAVPDSLLLAVPTEIAGPYHAWRMILNYAGQMVGTAISALLPLPVLFTFVIVSQLICGLGYFFSPVMRPKPRPSVTRAKGLHHGVKSHRAADQTEK